MLRRTLPGVNLHTKLCGSVQCKGRLNHLSQPVELPGIQKRRGSATKVDLPDDRVFMQACCDHGNLLLQTVQAAICCSLLAGDHFRAAAVPTERPAARGGEIRGNS